MKVTVLLILVIVLVALAANVTLGAVDSVDILIKALVDKQIITEDDAAAVRAEIAGIRVEEEAKKKSFNIGAKRPIKLSGYLQERYTHSNLAGFNDFFEAKRARLSLAGDATDKVDFKLQVDFAGSRSGLTSATLTPNADPLKTKLSTKSTNNAKPLLLDAVIGYKLSSDNRLSIGQFKVPFGWENLTSSTNLDTINRSLVTESLVPGRDTGNQGRDVGVLWSGVRPLDEYGARSLEYYLGAFNGSGINVSDDNDRKDPAARLVWNFGPSNAHLGVSYFNGAVGANSAVHTRTGTELVYVLGPYALKSEYIWGKDSTTNKSGWYSTLVRNFSSSTQGVIRFDELHSNTATQNDPVDTWTFGFNKFLNKDGYTRWQINYETRRGSLAASGQNQILAQFQAGF